MFILNSYIRVVKITNDFMRLDTMLMLPFEKIHACTHCENFLKKKHDLKSHNLTHTGVKPYQCSKYNKAFTHNYNLTIHMRIHIGERPYTCSQCNMHFITNSKLTWYTQTHKQSDNGKIHNCRQCDKLFSNKNDLERHIICHVLENTYSCSQCDQTCLRKKDLEVHMITHRGEKTHSCTLCEFFPPKIVILKNIF